MDWLDALLYDLHTNTDSNRYSVWSHHPISLSTNIWIGYHGPGSGRGGASEGLLHDRGDPTGPVPRGLPGLAEPPVPAQRSKPRFLLRVTSRSFSPRLHSLRTCDCTLWQGAPLLLWYWGLRLGRYHPIRLGYIWKLLQLLQQISNLFIRPGEIYDHFGCFGPEKSKAPHLLLEKRE